MIAASDAADGVDAHLHIWDPTRFDYPWFAGDPDLDQPRLPADTPQFGARSVLIEAACPPEHGLEEADWILEAATDAGLPLAAVVAAVPLEDPPALAERLDALQQRPLVRGVRRILMGEPVDLLRSDSLTAGLRQVAERGLTFDLAVLWPQLSDAAHMLEHIPGLPVVLDHLGKPPVAHGWQSDEAAQWQQGLADLVALPDVYAKLTGLTGQTPAERSLEPAVRPYIQYALEVFGPSRCMVGSDWPPSTSGGGDRSAAAWFDLVLDRSGLTRTERAQVAGETATRFYGPSVLLEHRP